MSDRLLVFRLGSIGDAVVALPAFHLIRQRFPTHHITLLTAPTPDERAAQLPAVLPARLYDEVLEYPWGTRQVRRLRRLRHQIAERRFPLMIALSEARGLWRSLRDYTFFRTCGVKDIRGFPFHRSDLERRPEPGTGLYRAEAARLLDRLRWLGEVDLADDRHWDLELTPEERKAADALLGSAGISTPVLAFSLGAKPDTNDWSQANWLALVSRLSPRSAALGLVAIGAAADAARSQELLDLWPGQTLNVCGRAVPRVSAALLRRAVLYVGHDSGPLHLAAAVGTPSVAVYSARNPPGQWFPLPHREAHTIFYKQTACFGCGLDRCPAFGKACILSIRVEDVAAAVEARLARTRCA